MRERGFNILIRYGKNMRKVCKHGNSKCMVLSKIRAEVVVELGWRVCVAGGMGGAYACGSEFSEP